MTPVLPHHDGSELYVSNEAPKLGEKIELRIRVPHAFARSSGLSTVLVRMYVDGEPRTFELRKSRKSNSVEAWWSVKVVVANPEMKYRFLLVGPKSYHWLTAAGLVTSNPTSNTDFRITARPAFPKWLRGAVFYQIFPDRFASSGKKRELPSWAIPRQWDLLPHGEGKTTSVEYYGGDFSGIESRIDHITKLGATGIYFTPFFPARSIHRYDASSFDFVDPLLGGDKEFISFSQKAHKLGLKILGDLTTNHTGAGHPWLLKGLKDKSSKEHGYYYFDKKIKHGYVGWWGLASLPKLNFNSLSLRKAFYEGENSIVRKWLRAPKLMDGWRIDVGNMTGRFKDQDMQRDVMRGIRRAMDETNPNAWLVAENGDWQTEDLDGFGWHGTMNYEGFMRPLWAWLGTGEKIGRGFHGLPIDPPTFTAQQFIESANAIKAAIPWRSLMASMTLLDSHDTARFRTVVGKKFDRHIAGMALLMTYPGVPSIFAGDEIGLEGAWGEDARRSMPWENTDTWDHDFFNETRALISIRKNSHAIANGGLRYICIEDDYFAFLRESSREST
ncbi:MAG: hypothetical protein RL414_427, partial [Actinomycetota bacterium]